MPHIKIMQRMTSIYLYSSEKKPAHFGEKEVWLEGEISKTEFTLLLKNNDFSYRGFQDGIYVYRMRDASVDKLKTAATFK